MHVAFAGHSAEFAHHNSVCAPPLKGCFEQLKHRFDVRFTGPAGHEPELTGIGRNRAVLGQVGVKQEPEIGPLLGEGEHVHGGAQEPILGKPSDESGLEAGHQAAPLVLPCPVAAAWGPAERRGVL